MLYVTDQNTDMREKKRHVKGEPPPAGDQVIVHFSLEGLLPTGEVLAVNRQLGFASILKNIGESPQILAEQDFAANEMRILLPLVSSYPDYCPNELLLASFTGTTTKEDVDLARQRLLRAREQGEWDTTMRPIRNYVSRVRQKIITLHFDVTSLFETGYILIPYTQGQHRRMRRH